jgi:hypothetical protein
MVSATDGSAFTSSVTVAVTIDAGTQATGTVGSGACTHEGNGYHTYAPSQAETNGALLAFTFTGTGAVPATVQVFTTGYDKTATTVPASGNVKKAASFAKFSFLMTDSTNHAPATGKTVTATISKDGGAFASLSSGDTVTEIANGIYEIDLNGTDTNANVMVLRFTATGCDDTFERIITLV